MDISESSKRWPSIWYVTICFCLRGHSFKKSISRYPLTNIQFRWSISKHSNARTPVHYGTFICLRGAYPHTDKSIALITGMLFTTFCQHFSSRCLSFVYLPSLLCPFVLAGTCISTDVSVCFVVAIVVLTSSVLPEWNSSIFLRQVWWFEGIFILESAMNTNLGRIGTARVCLSLGI